jgi:hypothetical protein
MADKANEKKIFITVQRKKSLREFNGVDRIVGEWGIGGPSALSVGINKCFTPVHTYPVTGINGACRHTWHQSGVSTTDGWAETN